MTEKDQPGLSAREIAAEYATGTVFDIDECAREPIHLLGSVQSYGALLALAEPGLTVAVASSKRTGPCSRPPCGTRSPADATAIQEDSAPLDELIAKRLDTIRWLASAHG